MIFWIYLGFRKSLMNLLLKGKGNMQNKVIKMNRIKDTKHQI